MKKVLLLYGMCGSSHQFNPLVRDLRARNLNPHVVPFNGHDGDGEPWRRLARRGYDDLTAEAIAYAELAWGGEKMLVAGHSQGGAVAHLAAEKRPDLFDAAVLFSPSLVGKMHPKTEKALKSRLWRYVLPFLFPKAKRFLIHPDDIKNLFFGGRVAAGFEESIATRMAHQPAATTALKELERKLDEPKVRTTVVVTEDDLVLDSGDQAKWARQHGCELVTLRGSHMSLILDGPRAGKIIQQAAA